MTRLFREFAELRALLDALCEETITPEQARRLEELILTHAEAEAYYVQYMSLYADLARQFAAPPGSREQALRERLAVVQAGPRARRGRRLLRRAALGLAGLAAGLLLALTLWPRPSITPPPGAGTTPEATDNTVAILLRAPGAEWEDTGLPTRAGARLPPGRLRLKSGYAHIEFYSGATVILEGPADFQLVSFNEAFCTHGKLRALVPPEAEGFTVRSPKLDLVDRGTEFGLSVDGNERTEVHVFKGKVELYDAGADADAAPGRELTTGRGVRLRGAELPCPIASDPDAFPTAQTLAEQVKVETLHRQHDWLEAAVTLPRDPSLVVCYRFQARQPWSRTLPDLARGREGPHDGAIVGCSWAAGRWEGKQGLEFKQVSDRVRFHVPGAFDALTLMAWVRVDALPNRFNSLMMTDGGEEAAPHWHISNTGRIELGVQGYNRKGWIHYLTPEVITPDRLGQWTHLAVVYDRQGGQVTHYVDGQEVFQEPLKLDIAPHLGDAELGNWNVGPRQHSSPIRYFSGCMDEFLLFSRALGAAEIEQLYRQGRPSS
jgi:hypothetical protein